MLLPATAPTASMLPVKKFRRFMGLLRWVLDRFMAASCSCLKPSYPE